MKIGISGHQRLDDPSGWNWVEAAMKTELDATVEPLTAVTSLAIGADQLLARLVLEKNGIVHAVLPFADCERTFAPSDLPKYKFLLRHSEVEILDTPGDDEDAYLAAGIRVADLSDLLIVVWNGLPAKGKGGTADIAAYALKKGTSFVHINPVNRTVVKQHPAR